MMNINHLYSMLSQSSFGVPSTRAKRIERRLRAVAEDDSLLRAEGMGSRLTRPELYEALEERGLCVNCFSFFFKSAELILSVHGRVTVDLMPEQAHKRLAWWLRETESGDVVGERVKAIVRAALERKGH